MINLTENTCLEGYTLLIPSTCVGNVSQLTADLLIENLKMVKVGNVFHDSIPPLIGLSAFEHVTDKVTTAAELYVDSKQLAVLQLRTPLTAPLMGDFFSKLVDFAKSHKVKDVIVLTACYGYEKHSVQGSDFAYYDNKNKDLSGIPGLDKAGSPLKILGGGYAVKLFEKFAEADIDTLVLYKYVSEGDNIPDAVTLLLKLNEIRKFVDVGPKNDKLTMPVSWKFLFGNRPPTEIY
ncbi:proteasome assembly chaperone 2 [Culicoides brevitarsis]|uniref:proteasome assembly chaperone 2 n=1 Tax=Culicoides brevitarsis TaxID=469753 RepID=UPI00307C809A